MKVQFEQRFIEAASLDWEEVGPGVRRKILAYGEDLMAVLVEFKKGSVGNLHNHPHRQITYIQSGAFVVHIEDEKKVLKTGDAYYIPAHLVHGVEALEDGVLIDVFTPMRGEFVARK